MKLQPESSHAQHNVCGDTTTVYLGPIMTMKCRIWDNNKIRTSILFGVEMWAQYGHNYRVYQY